MRMALIFFISIFTNLYSSDLEQKEKTDKVGKFIFTADQIRDVLEGCKSGEFSRLSSETVCSLVSNLSGAYLTEKDIKQKFNKVFEIYLKQIYLPPVRPFVREELLDTGNDVLKKLVGKG